MLIARLGCCALVIALVLPGRTATAQDSGRRIGVPVAVPALLWKPPLMTPGFARARESLALSRWAKPSDPDAKTLDVPSGVGMGVGAAGLTMAGLILLRRLLTKKESRKYEKAVMPHVLRISTTGAVVGIKMNF